MIRYERICGVLNMELLQFYYSDQEMGGLFSKEIKRLAIVISDASSFSRASFIRSMSDFAN